MKKFINEYKALRASKSDTGNSKKSRERVTVTTHSHSSDTLPQEPAETAAPVGTIRTEEYKRDLAEFQARRSTGKEYPELPDTPVKKKCGRHSLPVSCTDCTAAADKTFNYEKKSAAKYKKRTHKRARSSADDRVHDALPNIQFLFQNQVFMPGNVPVYPTYSEPRKNKRHPRRERRSPDFTQKHIDFNEDQPSSGTPLCFKNNSLPFDAKAFLETGGVEEIDGGLKFSLSLDSNEKTSVDKSANCVTKADNSDEKLWEVMSELKSFDRWADEQLQTHNSSKSDDGKSDSSAYGLPVACASNLEVDSNKEKPWLLGTWGVVPVQVKKLKGVPLEYVKSKLNTEVNILRKYRHPNIILLMGIYPDGHNNIHIICEQCIDSLYGILHVQGRILSAQTAVHYTLDIANALVFLRMQGYIHSALSSHGVMVNSHDVAKLTDLGPCIRLPKEKPHSPKDYEIYSPEPQYVNIEETRQSTEDSEPLLSQRSSETYLNCNAVAKEYKEYMHSERYRWQAPEMFEPDEDGLVHPCSKSDVYSLTLILWESCNAAVPWKTLTYEKLKELYTLWKTGVRLPQDGTYPGGLLALLRAGLTLSRADRIDLTALHSTLTNVKSNLDDIEYIVIPARVSKKQSNFSSIAWDSTSPTDDSECLSPVVQNVQLKAVVHKEKDTSDTSEKESKSDTSIIYETLRKEKGKINLRDSEGCYMSDNEACDDKPNIKYEHLQEKISSACSTPIAKMRARIRDIGTPGALHRSDSTEYCSILSPDNRYFAINEESKDESVEKSTAKLSRSFTPKSYKPLHIKVPECNLDSVKSILKDHRSGEQSSYNFDIKNYSLPSTPIARSNKLRKNAWLSGDITTTRSLEKCKDILQKSQINVEPKVQSAPETPVVSSCSPVKRKHSEIPNTVDEGSPSSDSSARDSFTGLRRVDPPIDFSPETDGTRDRTGSWSYKSSFERPSKFPVEEDVLSNVNVKPLVAIHERWIYEANRKTGRSMSLPENNRNQIQAVKPASHCVDTLQKSLPQLNTKRSTSFPPKPFRALPISPASSAKSGNWEQFCQARETVARNINFAMRDPERVHTWRTKEKEISSTEDQATHCEPKVNQATDTQSIEEFIRDLIRKEFQHLLHEISDDTSSATLRNDEVLNKGVANIVENLKNGDSEKRDSVRSFSRVKINGNNKPLLQITFTRSGENSLQVLDNCVNVTICDNNNRSVSEKLDVSMEETLTGDDIQVHSLKRCQAFNAIQEARSTEDLYIDDDLSTHMQENFGRVKLIPLHGSLHELLCERDDECCLLKVKQENGCDTIYFRCDNSDTESRDALDGQPHDRAQIKDTVVYKRSISLIEERIKRVVPKEKANLDLPLVRRNINIKTRPKSDISMPKSYKDTRVLSSSSPSLATTYDANDEVELNIASVQPYQDSSSEECLQCHMDNDDFEFLEKAIEKELDTEWPRSMPAMPRVNEGLEKISEENLSYDENAENEPVK